MKYGLVARSGCAACTPQASVKDDKEEIANAGETTKVDATLAKVGCKAIEVEKEAADLFEVDDADCAIG